MVQLKNASKDILNLRRQECYLITNGDKKIARNVVKNLKNLFHKQCYGHNYDHPKFSFSKEELNKARSFTGETRLIAVNKMNFTATQIWSHLATNDTDIKRFFYYVNKCVKIGNLRHLLIQFDIDSHKPGSNIDTAWIIARKLQSMYPGLYIEPSTHGNGLHCYLLASTDLRDNNSVCNQIDRLDSLIRGLFTQGYVSTVEVRGKPCTYSNDLIDDAGQLIKAPRPQSFEQYAILETLLKNPVELSSLAEAAKNNIDNTVRLCIKSRKSLKTDISVNTFNRVNAYCKADRSLHPDDSIEDSWTRYNAQGLNIGNSDRFVFEDNWKKYGHIKFQSCFTIDQAQQLFESKYQSEADLRYANRRLKKESVIKFIQYMTTILLKTYKEPNRQFSVSREDICKQCNMCPIEVKPMLSLVSKWQLIECTDRSYIVGGKIKGVSRKYGLMSSHPLYQKYCDLRGNKEAPMNYPRAGLVEYPPVVHYSEDEVQFITTPEQIAKDYEEHCLAVKKRLKSKPGPKRKMNVSPEVTQQRREHCKILREKQRLKREATKENTATQQRMTVPVERLD